MLWLLLVLWLVGLGIVVWRRSARGDGRSVEEFQQTLERLAPRDRGVDAGDRAEGRAAAPLDGPSLRKKPLVASRLPAERRPGLGRVALAAAITAALLVGALWAAQADDDEPATTAAPTSSPPATPPPSTVPAEPVPAEVSVELVSAEGDTRQYLVSRPGSTVSVVGLDGSWLEVRSGPDGPPIFEGVLEVGERQELTIDGPVWLRIGNPPGLEVAVDGAVLTDLPAEPVPVNVDLQV